MIVRKDELEAIRKIEKLAKYTGELEGAFQQQRNMTQAFIISAKEMNQRHMEIEKDQRRYITRLQVRLQNRGTEKAGAFREAAQHMEGCMRVGIEAVACMLEGGGNHGLAKMARDLKKSFVPS